MAIIRVCNRKSCLPTQTSYERSRVAAHFSGGARPMVAEKPPRLPNRRSNDTGRTVGKTPCAAAVGTALPYPRNLQSVFDDRFQFLPRRAVPGLDRHALKYDDQKASEGTRSIWLKPTSERFRNRLSHRIAAPGQHQREIGVFLGALEHAA